MDKVLLSQNRFDELTNQLKSLKEAILLANEENTAGGGPMNSFKEAAAFEVISQAKRQKIEELEKILKNAEILPEESPGTIIIIGKWFTIDNGSGTVRYRLVHPAEADPTKNLVSFESPLGIAVQNKKAGETYELNGQRFKIVSVE